MIRCLGAALLSIALLASCGGGDPSPQAPDIARAPLAKADPSACQGKGFAFVGDDCLAVMSELAPTRRERTQLQPQRALPVLTPQALFSWAEGVFPQFFRGASIDGTISPFVYRFYPATNTYLAVANGNVYVLGPLTNNSIMFVGALADFTCSVFPSACDVPGNASTSYTVAVGGSVMDVVDTAGDTAGDTDWFAVFLTAGSTYAFDLEGAPSGAGTLSDPYLRLFNGASTQVAVDDDSGTGNNARIAYTAPATGWYYLSAEGFGSATGSYRLSATLSSVVMQS